jgi:outer membrane protein assembly factor BamB
LWRRDLGRPTHQWGYAASPILYRDLCLLQFGPGERSFLIALNKNSGQTIWQFDFPPIPADAKWEDFGGDAQYNSNPGAAKMSEVAGSWATPLVVRAAGHDELVAVVPLQMMAFAPGTGRGLWTCAGPNIGAYSSAFFGDGIIGLNGNGLKNSSLAIKPGGRGDVTKTHRLWFESRADSKGCLGTGVIYHGHVFQITYRGLAECVDLATGNLVWEQQLTGSGAKNSCWSSPIIAHGRIYVPNQNGDVFVLRASPTYDCLATNSIGGELMNASLALSNGAIFIRTASRLWCVSAQ